MSKFVATSQAVEVSGSFIIAALRGAGEHLFPLLEEHGLRDIHAEAWYPEQAFLDVLHQMTVDSHFQNVDTFVSIGMRIPAHAFFPPDVNTMEGALMAMERFWSLNHHYDQSRWNILKHSDKHFTCISSSPYPSDLEYGILYALVKRFRPHNAGFIIKRDDQNTSRMQGGDFCTYHILLD